MMKYSILFLFIIAACNSALFVPKQNIVYKEDGYIVFYYPDQKALFFPWSDTLDTQFLQASHKNGYRIDRNNKDLMYLSELAVSHIVTKYVRVNNQSSQVMDSIRILPIRLKYYWGDAYKTKKQMKNDQQITIRYSYSGSDIELSYRIYDERQLLLIVPIRKSDIIRVKETVPNFY